MYRPDDAAKVLYLFAIDNGQLAMDPFSFLLFIKEM